VALYIRARELEKIEEAVEVSGWVFAKQDLNLRPSVS
jgi:hypothetical protein